MFFHDKEMHRAVSNQTCLAVIAIALARFQKNISRLKKKKRWVDILLMT